MTLREFITKVSQKAFLYWSKLILRNAIAGLTH